MQKKRFRFLLKNGDKNHVETCAGSQTTRLNSKSSAHFVVLMSKVNKTEYQFHLNFLGDLERLRRFWLTGTCNPKKEEKKASEPLAPEQFLSAFFLLLCGIGLAVGLMGKLLLIVVVFSACGGIRTCISMLVLTAYMHAPVDLRSWVNRLFCIIFFVIFSNFVLH